MIGGDDISWSSLGQIVREWAGDPAELTEVIPLHGGSVNNTLLLVTGDKRRAVLKITPHRVNRELEVEAFQLDLLRSIGIPTPRVYSVHVASLEYPNSYLLMEHIGGVTLAELKKTLPPEEYEPLQQELADLVAKIHDQCRDAYGKVDGSDNHRTNDWVGFYRSLHDHALQAVRDVKEIPIKTRKKIDKLHERLDRFLVHDDRPRLCHGDFWAANVMCRQEDGRWRIAAIIDPHLHFGHAENELAYIDLFETATSAFRKRYQERFRLTNEYYNIRKPIYQLYPLIDHVQMFGPRYVAPLMKVAERAIAVV